ISSKTRCQFNISKNFLSQSKPQLLAGIKGLEPYSLTLPGIPFQSQNLMNNHSLCKRLQIYNTFSLPTKLYFKVFLGKFWSKNNPPFTIKRLQIYHAYSISRK